MFGSSAAGADPNTLRKALDFSKYDLMQLVKLYFKWQAHLQEETTKETSSIFALLSSSSKLFETLTLSGLKYGGDNFVEQRFKVLEVKPEDTEITWEVSYRDKSQARIELQGFLKKEVLPEPIVETSTAKPEDLPEPIKHAIREALKEKLVPVLLAKQFVSLVENQLEKELNASA